MTFPCDYCDSKSAVLYCRADSARLCLVCDQHVHSANALSLKHVRSQICDNCRNDAASVRCLTDNLVLCPRCDWDSHGGGGASSTTLHQLRRVEGLSGCPSVTEIASALGIDFRPNDAVSVPEFGGPPVVPVCGKRGGGDEVYEQVVEVAKRKRKRNNLEGPRFGEVDGVGFKFNDGSNGNGGIGNEVADLLLQQQTPFTLLLAFPSEYDAGIGERKNNDYGTEAGVLLWNRNPAYQPPQVRKLVC